MIGWRPWVLLIGFLQCGLGMVAQVGTTEELLELRWRVFKRVHSAPDSVYEDSWRLTSGAVAAQNDSLAGDGHYYLSSIWNWRGNLDSALVHARTSLQYSIRSGSRRSMAAGYNMLGNVYESLGQLDSAILAFKASYREAEADGDTPSSLARALLNIGMVQRTLGDYAGSLEHLHRAKDLCEEHDFTAYLPNLFYTIGDVYQAIGETDLAVDAYHHALRQAHHEHRSRIEAGVLQALGGWSLTQGDTLEAVCWLEQARQCADANGVHVEETKALASLASLYMQLGRGTEALAAANQAVGLAREVHDTVVLAKAQLGLGQVLLKRGSARAAYAACTEAYAAARATKQRGLLQEICDCQWQSAEGAGLYAQSLRHYREVVALRDSLTGRDQSMAIARLEARLDYARQRSEDSLRQIAISMQREAVYRRELASELELRRLSQWLGALGLALAVFAVGAVVVFYRQNRRLASQYKTIQEQHEAIRTTLQEKDVLLREVHHRVKNNLQIMSSLLQMQESGVDDRHALEVLQASRGRVASMSLIHQRLYQQDQVANLDFGTYLQELVQAIQALYPEGRKVDLRVEVGNCVFPMDVAVPLSLIVNELVTNAFKYAYRDREAGQLGVSLQPLPAGGYRLCVEDDGPGLGDAGAGHGLGLQLVMGLARQLKGGYRAATSRWGGAGMEVIFEGGQS